MGMMYNGFKPGVEELQGPAASNQELPTLESEQQPLDYLRIYLTEFL